MRWIALALCLLASPASAQWGGGANIVNVVNPQVQPPSGSPGLPAIDDNLVGPSNTGVASGTCAEFGHQVPCTNHYAITRASVKYCQAQSNGWRQALSGQACITNQGQLIEESRVNVVLWDRDLTQVGSWTAINATTALNYTGVDGTANAATTITATAGNATVLQAITLASSARFQTAFVQRVTGSGVVNMTMDAGLTWTAITPCAATAAFGSCRVSIPTQTLANPTVGFQIVTNGDAIAVDFVQNENGTFVTSPIATTTVSVTRAADSIQAFGALLTILSSNVGSFFSATNQLQNVSNSYIADRDATVNSYPVVTASTTAALKANGGNIAPMTIGSGSYSAGAVKTASSWDTNGASLVGNNGTVATSATAYTSLGTVSIGSRSASLNFIDGNMTRIAVWPSRLPDTTLKALTQ